MLSIFFTLKTLVLQKIRHELHMACSQNVMSEGTVRQFCSRLVLKMLMGAPKMQRMTSALTF
jgi:hypothetical protein